MAETGPFEDAQASSSWLMRLRHLIWRSPDEHRSERLRQQHELEKALNRDPDSVVMRIYRAELRLAERDCDGAAADFRAALDLAAAQIAEEPWALVAQVMQDRALCGLMKTTQCQQIER